MEVSGYLCTLTSAGLVGIESSRNIYVPTRWRSTYTRWSTLGGVHSVEYTRWWSTLGGGVHLLVEYTVVEYTWWRSTPVARGRYYLPGTTCPIPQRSTVEEYTWWRSTLGGGVLTLGGGVHSVEYIRRSTLGPFYHNLRTFIFSLSLQAPVHAPCHSYVFFKRVIHTRTTFFSGSARHRREG